jgi:hypothetical protein
MTDMTTEGQPIACTLAGEDFRERLAWIAALTREAMRSYERNDLVLNLRYAPEAASRVREMMRKEQTCCSFLTFEMQEHPDEVRLRIRAPENARASADALFEPFVAPARECEDDQDFPDYRTWGSRPRKRKKHDI